MFAKKVACGSFVKRQTKESGHSHFDGTWEQLENLAAARLSRPEYADEIHPGYKDGVVLVDMPPNWFYSAVVDLHESSKLTANYAPRREGEDSIIRVSAKAKKQAANYAQVVLYRHDVLEENDERETEAEWEIVSIKARVSIYEDPMDPMTMARNFLHLPGGTQGDFSALQFAESIVYWNNHAMTTGCPKWYRAIANWFRGNK